MSLILCMYDEEESARTGQNCGLAVECVSMKEVLLNVPHENDPSFSDFTYYVSEK
jgi:hypothetical protein